MGTGRGHQRTGEGIKRGSPVGKSSPESRHGDFGVEECDGHSRNRKKKNQQVIQFNIKGTAE